MHHIMREDPQQRFCYSFTVEDGSLHIWFANRAEILVSDRLFRGCKPVQGVVLCGDRQYQFFRNQPLDLVRFFLSVMYAEPHQLGWDTTMQVLHDGEQVRYKITVFDDQGISTTILPAWRYGRWRRLSTRRRSI